jgi:hypothetical protein
MWDLWWTKGHWGFLSPSSSVSQANHSTDGYTLIIIIIIWSWYNRPVEVLAIAKFHSTTHKKKIDASFQERAHH